MNEIIEKRKNGFAIAGLIFSILGLIPFTFFVPSILGLIFGIVGLVKVKKCGSGKAMSIVSIILGVLGIALNIFYFFFIIIVMLEGAFKGIIEGIEQGIEGGLSK